jgi:hypothetical protein
VPPKGSRTPARSHSSGAIGAIRRRAISSALSPRSSSGDPPGD